MNEPGLAGGFGDGADLARLHSVFARDDSPVLRVGPLAVAAADLDPRGVHGTSRTLCIIDGTVTNSAELATVVGEPPETSPAVLVALGFERLETAVLEHLEGEFVVLIWDRELRRGALARDRLGSRPLFLRERGRGLLFASEVRDLLALLSSQPATHEVALAHWLARRPPPRGTTLFEGITRLPAGHMLDLSDAGVRLRRWWEPRYRPPLTRDRDEVTAGLRGEMAAAVERASTGAEAPGVLLSGGFDSASVAALMSPPAGAGDARAYSRVFPGHPDVDESERIAVVRDHLGLRCVEAPFTGGSALAATAQFISEWSVPPVSPNWFIWRGLLQRAARDGIDVLLDGEGGDELFGCSPALLADLLRRGRLGALYSTARSLPGMTSHPRPRWVVRAVRDYGIRMALPPSVHRVARRLRGDARRARPWLARSTRDHLVASERPYVWKQLPGPRWWAGLVDALIYAPDRIGAADQLRRESALAGLKFAHPWRDLALIQHVLTQAPELAFDPDLDRPLARAAMQGLVPDRIRLSVAKPHFNQLLTEALTSVDRPFVEDLLLNPPDEIARHLNRPEVSRLLGSQPTIAWPLDVWHLATAAAWMRGLEDPDALEPLLAAGGPPADRGVKPR